MDDRMQLFGPLTDFGDGEVSASGDTIELTLIGEPRPLRVRIPTGIVDLVACELCNLRETASARIAVGSADAYEPQALAVIAGIAVEPQDRHHIAITVRKRDGGCFGFVLPRANIDEVCAMMRQADEEEAMAMTRQ